MRRKKTKLSTPLLQLCMFDETQMLDMIEVIDNKTAPLDNSDAVQWQLAIAQSLTGKAWREHRAIFNKSSKK